MKRSRVLTLGAAALLAAPAVLTAQVVGHPPASSPFQEIPKGNIFAAMGSWIGGNGGDLRVGPHHGLAFGLRYTRRLSSLVAINVGVARAELERRIVDPFVALDERVSGPVDQPLTMADAGLQFNLTGGKAWHGVAPFIAFTAGLAFGGEAPAADTSGYEFGNEFFFVPSAGTRVFLTDRLHVRAEAAALAWQLSYPDSFGEEPAEQPGTPDNSNAVITDGQFSEWTLTPQLRFGLGYTF